MPVYCALISFYKDVGKDLYLKILKYQMHRSVQMFEDVLECTGSIWIK